MAQSLVGDQQRLEFPSTQKGAVDGVKVSQSIAVLIGFSCAGADPLTVIVGQ